MRTRLGAKERIERAALRLFVERGVEETSIRDIARAAKVSQGAMYNHYASKEELAWALFAENFSEIGFELRQRAHEYDTLEGRLRAMIGYVFERFDRDWLPVGYIFLVRHHFLARLDRKLGNPYLVFRSVITTAMRHGEISRQDPDVATSLVIGAVIQVFDTKILGHIKTRLLPLADDVAAACRRILDG